MPGKNHGSVGEGIQPRHVFKEMIADHADPERASQDGEPSEKLRATRA